jgi:CRP-like cAMP-binding protein|tara:strand:+ start:156 stop:1082 length:927 start_codon:yes stop_codon:yes gene_type:complete
MDISQHLQRQQKITFHTDTSGKAQDYPCTVKKIKKNLIAVILEDELKNSPVCDLGIKIILKWTTDNKPYSLLTKIAQNKTFPLVILNKQGEINEKADKPPLSSAEAPVATPPAPPEAAAEKLTDDKAIPFYSYAEKKALDPEAFEYIRDLINEVPQLYSLGPDEVISLVPYVNYKSAQKGSLIFKEGDPADSLFYIAKGAVDIVKEAVEGTPIKLAQFTKDSLIGEMALIDSAPRSTTAKVFADVELIILNRESFDGLLKDAPTVGIKIFKQIVRTMGQRVGFANGRLADVLDQAHQQGIALEDKEIE